MTGHRTPYAKDPSEFVSARFPVVGFVEDLRKLSGAKVETKDELWLFNPTEFQVQDGQDGYRRIANFARSHAMFLDFDNGMVSPEDFKRLFKDWSFIIYNSFSRSPDEPNRFRVIIFYSKAAETVAVHHGLYDFIEWRLAENGFPPDTSGLDRMCRTGVQSFWVPATNRAHPDWSFFDTNRTQKRELARYAIDPNEYALPDEMILDAEQQSDASSAEPTGTSPSATSEMVEVLLAPIRGMREGRYELARTAFLKMYHRHRLSFAEIAILWNTLGRDDNIKRMRAQFEKLAKGNDVKAGRVTRTG